MTLDPYRTLGLEPGASMAEVKRAYRRLAKAFHPDSAGEAALPRFLAIHEAYEAIRTGRSMGATRAPTRPATRPAEPWRADPARARAARERARTGRARAGAAGSAGAGAKGAGAAGAGREWATGERDGARSSRSSASSGTSGSAGTRSRRGGTRKATLGSTSYDEARDPADATWSGASWYGPTSGEYWIINPREYADPRKHGPEYQSRARRMAAASGVSGTIGQDGQYVEMPVDEAPPTDDEAAAETRAAAADPARARARRARSAPMARPEEPSIAADRRPRREDLGDVPPARTERAARASLETAARDLLDGSTDDPVRRIGVALVAWPPLGLAAAGAIGQATGCASYSTTCGGTDALLPWLAQAGILGLLLLLPPLARILAGGSIGIVVALLPLTAFLLVVGAGGEPEAPYALWFLLAIAWVVGVGATVAGTVRRRIARTRAGGSP